MGLGVHGGGVGVARFFARRGAKVLVTDLKKKEELRESIKALSNLPIKYVLGEHREEDFKNADLVIQNPAVPRDSKFLRIARGAGVKIETDTGLFFELFKGLIIGITGTKGKTTTATLLYEILKGAGIKTAVAGNIRVSMLDILDEIDEKTTCVLELSSWQLEGLLSHRKSPHIAVVLNVMPDHLDRYEDFDDYVRAKELIFRFQTKDDFLVLNFDDNHCQGMAKKAVSKIFWFSRKKEVKRGVFVKNGEIFFRRGRAEKKSRHLLALSNIRLPGEHNIQNVLAAVTVAGILDVKEKIIKKVVSRFKGVSFRLELVGEKNGLKYYNDSTATNPGAAIAALDSFPEKVSLIAGGTDKNLDFEGLAKKVSEKAKKVVLFEGTATEKLEPLLKKYLSKDVPVLKVNNMKEAVEKATRGLQKGDIVLLSPGAASFGIFKNEFDRGEQFNEIVKNLN